MKYPEIAKRFNHIMNLRQIKAVDLARKSSVSKAAISQYVNGNRCPSTDKAIKLGKILNCNPIWLMDLDNRMEVTTFAMTEKGQDFILIDNDIKLIIEEMKTLPKDTQSKIIKYMQMLIKTEKEE